MPESLAALKESMREKVLSCIIDNYSANVVELIAHVFSSLFTPTQAEKVVNWYNSAITAVTFANNFINFEMSKPYVFQMLKSKRRSRLRTVLPFPTRCSSLQISNR